MSPSFDDFADRLQEQINEEVIQKYGKRIYERWRNPRFMGRMENPTAYACVTGNCGDTMEIFLRLEEDAVVEASYTTDGCGCGAACASVACELAVGKKTKEIADVTGETILEVLEGIPEDDIHCAFLAAETLQIALSECRSDNGKDAV
ncbi:MAG: iron-sulfur cluster assembly scaffold protein [Deltaproteobacteria bacterium]|nr:iron-sulfur cluster assembly scaffold protein [Deltaproteobacteria bacterium]